MVEYFGKNYYIDLDGITDKCRTTNTLKSSEEETEGEDEGSLEINIFKYEIIKMCLERILGEYEEVDEEMGVFAQKNTSTSFKIAFNTLIKYKILIEDLNEDDE
jgi:hypothetical protein